MKELKQQDRWQRMCVHASRSYFPYWGSRKDTVTHCCTWRPPRCVKLWLLLHNLESCGLGLSILRCQWILFDATQSASQYWCRLCRDAIQRVDDVHQPFPQDCISWWSFCGYRRPSHGYHHLPFDVKKREAHPCNRDSDRSLRSSECTSLDSRETWALREDQWARLMFCILLETEGWIGTDDEVGTQLINSPDEQDFCWKKSDLWSFTLMDSHRLKVDQSRVTRSSIFPDEFLVCPCFHRLCDSFDPTAPG